MAVNEKMVRKIQLLLNKTKNNPCQEEVQTAFLMAQRLMAEYGISQAEVDSHEEGTIPVKKVSKSSTNYERLVWWKKSLARVIAENFRCYNYISRNASKSRIVFLGLEQDVELAKMTFEFACDALKYGTDQFVKLYRIKYKISKPTEIRNDYMSGWIQGLKAQYKEQVEKNNWGLILVKDALVKQEYESMKLRKGRSSSITISGNSTARSAGYQDGKSFSSPRGKLQA